MDTHLYIYTEIYYQAILAKIWNFNCLDLIIELSLADSNIIKGSWDKVEKKLSYRKNETLKFWVSDITFLAARPSLYVTFCQFFVNPLDPCT